MMNDNKRYIGTYRSERELLNKINEMKAQGFKEDDLYVVANNEDKVSMVRGQTDVDLTSPENTSWMHKFKSYFTGEEPVMEALSGMGFSDEEARRYYSEAQTGGLLLFADRDQGKRFDEKRTGLHGKGMDTANSRVDEDPLVTGAPNLHQRVGAEAVLDRDTEAERGRLHKTREERLNETLGADTTKPFHSGIGRDVNKDTRATGLGDDNLIGRDATDMGAGMGTGLGADKVEPFRKGPALRNNEDEQKMRLHEERLNVDKNMVETGEVNVNKHVETERQQMDVPVQREEVHIERRPVNETPANGHEVFDDGENIHIPVKQEKVDVTKRPVVNEEIVIGKQKVVDTEHIDETVRREKADIDRTGDTNEANLTNKRRDDRDPLL
ncbi:YsnF/AvaK domain-containing protein [Aciduricibacillus chroicocephali]|uniref:YsnF/AvaK domain-containing protein n=1 Tax=Aciduricibacillus chroicocephali TaxID=3054939 RepID=A0ABY9KTM3_9BACI|nr:YsnF/AvaK domain-containing protein [Bacillaceae bacterium 44XB]